MSQSQTDEMSREPEPRLPPRDPDPEEPFPGPGPDEPDPDVVPLSDPPFQY